MLNHPIRLAGAALTLVVAALACVVLFVPIAAGSSPSGKDQVKRYASIKSGAPLKIVSRTDIFLILGANFGDSDANKVSEVDCLDLDKSSPTYMDWIPIDSFGDLTLTGNVDSKHIEVLIGEDASTNGCITKDPKERLRVRFNAPLDDLDPVTGFVDRTGPRLVIKGTPTVAVEA
jgi:hypothetical protein